MTAAIILFSACSISTLRATSIARKDDWSIRRMTYYDIIVIGAGIGGLTAAALLGRAGYRVLALEGHIEPGGCASSFERRRPGGERYVFDVGATLFAGFTPGGAHHWVGQRLGIRWPVRRLEPALEAWEAERFWHEQERIADIAWRYAARQPPVPPETPVDLLGMSVRARPEMALLVPQLWRTVGQALSSHGIADRRLRAFVDGQLLISAQATARECAWLYGAVALDFARIGAHYVEGGAWSLARTLAAAFTRDGGELRYRTWVKRILTRAGRAIGVETERGEQLFAGQVVANVTL